MRIELDGYYVEYFGWFTILEASEEIKNELSKKISSLQNNYPLNVQYVNGNLHVIFSGCPNHYHGQAHDIMELLSSKLFDAFGQVTLINHDYLREPYILKLINGEVEEARSKDITLADMKKMNS